MIEKLIEKLKGLIQGDFFQNVTVLMSGTAIAQGLAFAASPILSRLYDPSAFGVFGLFAAACSIVAVSASAKYELAILLPKKDEDAANVLWLSLGIIGVVTFFSFFLVLFFRVYIAELLGSPELAPLLWWAPASIFFTGLYNAFNFWTTRRKKYKRLSISRVIQTSGREGTQLGLGFFTGLQGSGLVFGHVFGQASSAAALVVQTYREDYKLVRNSYNEDRIKILAKEHQDFPKYNAPQNILNSVSQNVPAILLAYFFNPTVVGLYWFTYRILVAPNKLIGNSVRQVFYQRANELLRKGGNALGLYLKTTGGLAAVGVLPLLVLLFFGPVLFDFIFGSNWYEAGRYAQWLSIWWFVGFINPPSVMMIPILNLQKFQLFYEVILTGMRILAITIGGLYSSAIFAIALFSLAGLLANSFLIVFVGLLMYKTKNSNI